MLKVAVVALLLAGCAYQPAIPGVCLSDEVREAHPQLETAMRAAADAYCEQRGECVEVLTDCQPLAKAPSGGSYVWAYAPDAPNTLFSSESTAASYADHVTHAMYFYRSVAGERIVLKPEGEQCREHVGDGTWETRAYVLAAHELGHALGYGHAKQEVETMFPSSTCSPVLRNRLPGGEGLGNALRWRTVVRAVRAWLS